MLDKVHITEEDIKSLEEFEQKYPQYIKSVFRCDFCTEIILIRKASDYLECFLFKIKTALHVACSQCLEDNINNAKDMMIKSHYKYPLYRVSTFFKINEMYGKSLINAEERIQVMKLAHFIGDRPKV